MGFISITFTFVAVILIPAQIIPTSSYQRQRNVDKLEACRAICGRGWGLNDPSQGGNLGRSYDYYDDKQTPCLQSFSVLEEEDHRRIDYLQWAWKAKLYLVAADFDGREDARYIGIYHTEPQHVQPINTGRHTWTYDWDTETSVLGSTGGNLLYHDTNTDELRINGPPNAALLVKQIQFDGGNSSESADFYICRAKPSVVYFYGIVSSRNSSWICQVGGDDNGGGRRYTKFSILSHYYQKERELIRKC